MAKSITNTKQRGQRNEVYRLIEEKNRLETELELSKERLDLSLSAGNLAWWEMDVQTGMVNFNQNKILMMGFTPEDFGTHVHYTKFTDLLHPEDYPKAMEAMRMHLEGSHPLYEIEYRIKCKTGDYLWFYDRGSVTDFDGQGKPLKVKGIVFDCTDRKRAEERLIISEQKLSHSNASKDKFFSIIAHDLKSPFNSILGFSMFLKDHFKEIDDDEKLYIVSNIFKVGTNAYDLLEDLLTWARAESETMAFAPGPCSLNKLFKRNIEYVQGQAEQKSINLIGELEKDIFVLADEKMLDTVLRNLLSNAVKYTRKGGYVKLFAAILPDNQVHMQVIDDGVGIPEDKLDDIFTISKKHQTAGTENEKGTGLGLILCKQLVEKNHGQIWCESKCGYGTRFNILIPSAT